MGMAYCATVNPLPNDFAETICCATLTIELPHAAPGPLNPSSVPNGFGGCFTLSMINSTRKKIKYRMWKITKDLIIT